MPVNLIIKVDDNFKPHDEDIIVYNQKKDKWEVKSKVSFFAQTKKELIDKDEKIKNLKNEICALNSKISKLAKIVKGGFLK